MPTPDTLPSEDDADLFVEQAEYIESTALLKWSTEHPDEEMIVRKLSQGGAKLITGPRGCGKTTLLLKTFYKLCQGTTESSSLPIYVNFKSSLKLEPLYKNQANAVFWFTQWLIFKVYEGLLNTLRELESPLETRLRYSRDTVNRVTNNLELGRTDLSGDEASMLTIPLLEEEVSTAVESLGKSRCVLLLDDAAHAFSFEQQRDFFDFFRKIKSRIISPKAAIYPGVTIFSSTFHLGHDAEEIDVWIRPDSPRYVPFMHDLLKRRLPSKVSEKLNTDIPLLTLVCYAAFGAPRSLLNMIRSFYNEDSYEVSFTRAATLKAVRDSFQNALSIYSSLKSKLPIYEKFVTTGEILFGHMTEFVKAYNKDKPVDHQSVTIAIKRPLPPELSKVLGFFQYAGLLLPKGEVSRGEKGTFEQYVIHYAALIDRNALFGRKALNVAEVVEAFSKRNPHEFTRVTPSSLIGHQDLATTFTLSLPPCQVCRTPRISEHAKFCPSCGTPLKTASIFESLVNEDISRLPLTKGRVAKIKDHSSIRRIKDILIDHDHRQLRGVPQVGAYWANRIYSYAEEYIA